jgi:shikimate kinase
MIFHGKAVACGAGTIVNAISTWRGAAFALDLHTTAEVMLTEGEEGIRGVIEGGGDTRLIELAVKRTLERFNLNYGGMVKTTSELPQASGLKSSSAAANAAVLATLAAIGKHLPSVDVINLGVDAAIEAGVTVTGAFDDAAASFLGGVVVTDNRERRLLRFENLDAEVVVFVPPVRAYSGEVDVERCRLIAPWVREANRRAEAGDYWHAMTLNGLLYCAALGFSPEPILDALEAGAVAASLSGTGSSYVAVVEGEGVDGVVDVWSGLEGGVVRTKIDNRGGYIV